jgi:uncharacterized membrane protein
MNLIPFVLTILAIAFGTIFAEFEIGLLLGLFVGLVALQRETNLKVISLQDEIQRLSETPDKTSAQSPAPDSNVDTQYPDRIQTQPSYTRAASIPAQADRALQFQRPEQLDDPAPTTEPPQIQSDSQAGNPFDSLLERIKYIIWSYFNDGNLFVRVGLLILFFGVAFLLKYAAENSRIPLEYRFLGAAAGGLGLLIAGWRLRSKKEIYALLLQGGGIGIIYITIFASFRIANLIPSTLTFALLVVFAAFTSALAILQNSRALAIYAVLGGFLAPFLASTGSGNFIGLFSYYAVLNAAIFIIAWFKSWRLLNLLGFAFTFSVYTLWVVFSYKTTMLLPAMGFLLLFFAMYSLIGVLYALIQTHSMKGIVDGTLVFGTPVIASSLLMAMVRHLEYGIALAAVGIGFYYVVLARLLWNRSGDALRLLAEAMLAIGVVFATLAIPYALDGHWTSATWALEAAAILWISIRQQRQYAQWFAIALQFGAGVLFLWRNVNDLGDLAWVNPAFLGGVFIALGAFISARLLYKLDFTVKIRPLHTAFFVWAMCWWLGSALVQIDAYVDNQIIAWLLLFSITASVLAYFDRVRRRNWLPASISSALLLPVLILISLQSINDFQHVLVLPDALIWLLAWAINYRLIVRLEDKAWPEWIKVLLHSVFVVFVTCVLSLDLIWYFQHQLPGVGQGFIALLTVIPLIVMYAARTVKFPAILRYGVPLQLGIITPLALILAFWSVMVNFTNTANPTPIPYLPFINPVDLAHMVFYISVIRAMVLLEPPLKAYRNHVLIFLGGLIFIWLSAVLLRSMHHYADIPFNLLSMSRDTKIQTALSILWTVIGMLAMLFASRKMMRPVWIAGAVLIAVVLIKMFFIDLDASGTVERIVSFLVVGGLLVAMGYFSPIPDRRGETRLDTGGVKNAH